MAYDFVVTHREILGAMLLATPVEIIDKSLGKSGAVIVRNYKFAPFHPALARGLWDAARELEEQGCRANWGDKRLQGIATELTIQLAHETERVGEKLGYYSGLPIVDGLHNAIMEVIVPNYYDPPEDEDDEDDA